MDQSAGAIDVHAHYFGAGLTAPSAADPEAPRLEIDGDSGRIMCGDRLFRRVPGSLWDVPTRIEEMAAAGIAHQVISPVPVAMEHAWAASTAPAYARMLNDSIAAACRDSAGRLFGLGCLPLSDPDEALVELARCRSMGLCGIQVGTRIAGTDLDDARWAPLWASCENDGAAVFVHPVDEGRTVVRRAGQPYDLGLGMLTDTAIAATALVFGGVLARHPRLKVALAHGCGTFAWAYPRLRVAAQLRGPATGRSDGPAEWDEQVGRLYVDSLVFDDEHLRLLAHRFGPDRMLLGTDAPFFPGQMAASVHSIDHAVRAGMLPNSAPEQMTRNALEFLGR